MKTTRLLELFITFLALSIFKIFCFIFLGLMILGVGSTAHAYDNTDWIWFDDFEDGLSLSSKYEDISLNGLSVSSDDTFSGINSLKQTYSVGQVDAGWIIKVMDSGYPDHLFVRWYHKFEDGFVSTPPKMARMRYRQRFGDWTSIFSIHCWIDNHEVVADVKSANGWLPIAWSGFSFTDPSNIGRWVCYEMEVKLNTPGQSDGHYRMWIDDNLVIERLQVNLRGNYSYHMNEVSLDCYWNGGAPQVQSRYFDDFVISTSKIGLKDNVPPNGDNVIDNPGFETSDMTIWLGNVTQSTANPYEGSYCGLHSAVFGTWQWLAYQQITSGFSEGDTLSASAFMRSDSGQIKLTVRYLDSSGERLGTDYNSVGTTSTDWDTQIADTSTIPAGTATIEVGMRSMSQTGTGAAVDGAEVIVTGNNPTPELLLITASIAGAEEVGNNKENTYDTNTETRWASDGTLENAWIEYDLGSTKTIAHVNLVLYRSLERTYPIQIQVDGTTVFTGNTVMAQTMQTIDVTDTNGSSVRIVMTGNNSSGHAWFSICETEIWGAQ